MRLRSTKTKLEHEVTPEGWIKMKARGDSSKYTILSNGSRKGDRKPMPEEVRKATPAKPEKAAVATPKRANEQDKNLLD